MSNYFAELTNEQIAALTDEQINARIDFICAQAGVPIFLERPTPPKTALLKDHTVCRVAGFNFASRADAEAVRSLIQNTPRLKQAYDRKTYRHLDYMEPDDGAVAIEDGLYFSPETFAKHQIEIGTLDRQKADYEKAAEKYDSAIGEREKIAARVWNDIYEARQQVTERNRILNVFDRYVKLAEGDRRMAWNFLKAAEKLTDEDAQAMNLEGLLPAAEVMEAVEA